MLGLRCEKEANDRIKNDQASQDRNNSRLDSGRRRNDCSTENATKNCQRDDRYYHRVNPLDIGRQLDVHWAINNAADASDPGNDERASDKKRQSFL